MSYQYCPDANVDPSTGQCTVTPVWVPGTPGGLPPLTGAEGAEISAAILGCWCIGYVGRLIRYALKGRIS